MDTRPARLLSLSLASVGLLAGAAAGDEVPRSAFSANATHIDFDNLAGGADITSGEIITNQYAAQGVTFNNPDQFTRANAFAATFYSTNSDPNLAFVTQAGGSTTPPLPRPQEILFASPQLRVGCWFGTSFAATVTMRAYNGDTLLEELTKAGDSLSGGGLEGFVGLQRSEGITKVTLSSASDSAGFGPFNFSFDDLLFEAGAASCYANCDGSTSAPMLNVADFTCFLQKFAAADPYANCDGSTSAPILNVADFTCFLQKFAAGCP